MEKNNSLSYSLNIWVFSVLAVPIIAGIYNEYYVIDNSWSDFLSAILIGPLILAAFSIPLHVLFVYLNNYLFKKVRRESFLRFLINISALVTGLPFIIFINSSNNFFFIGLDIIVITMWVWVLKIEREEIKEAISPPRHPDILDDDF